ncbi:MAG: M56 family metallopeptidase [Erythrobacter cryptus]
MSAVMLETLVWTGVLIALVLVLRRAVARSFGPEAAYALWALPVLRLVLPPITLPAAMAPAALLPAAPAPASGAMPLALAPEASAVSGEAVLWAASASAPVADPGAPVGFDLFALLDALPLGDVLLALWLGGAGVFLWRRFAAYFALRAALLAEAREVGRVRGRLAGWLPESMGAVRLVETPATSAPLAFGVLDRVIALPCGFLAMPDRQARDLALAHELAHHRGGDLLVNFLVQPLFALHWFNPLAHYGWLALRRDQEAACDARVVARCSPAERAAYAALIARFAGAARGASPVALSAPMACPVLGESSILHRLRSMSMSHITERRRLAGRALVGAGLLALPLTASICYAAAAPRAAAAVPPAPPAAPEAPVAPQAPAAPEAPEAPEAPAAGVKDRIIFGDGTHRVITADGEVMRAHTITDKDGKTATMRLVLRDRPDAPRGPEGSAGEETGAEIIELSLREGMAALERVRRDMPRILEEARRAAEEARSASAEARAAMPRIVMRRHCKPGEGGAGETSTSADGKTIITICEARAFAAARSGLERARAEIARDPAIPEAMRKRLIEQLDREIARWRAGEGEG